MKNLGYNDLQALNFIISTINEMNYDEVIMEALNTSDSYYLLWHKLDEKIDEIKYRNESITSYLEDLDGILVGNQKMIKKYLKERASEIARITLTAAFDRVGTLTEEDFDEHLERRVRCNINDRFRFFTFQKDVVDYIMTYYNKFAEDKLFDIRFKLEFSLP